MDPLAAAGCRRGGCQRDTRAALLHPACMPAVVSFCFCLLPYNLLGFSTIKSLVDFSPSHCPAWLLGLSAPQCAHLDAFAHAPVLLLPMLNANRPFSSPQLSMGPGFLGPPPPSGGFPGSGFNNGPPGGFRPPPSGFGGPGGFPPGPGGPPGSGGFPGGPPFGGHQMPPHMQQQRPPSQGNYQTPPHMMNGGGAGGPPGGGFPLPPNGLQGGPPPMGGPPMQFGGGGLGGPPGGPPSGPPGQGVGLMINPDRARMLGQG